MNLKDYIWVIGTVIYVGGMFPIYYAFTFLHMSDFAVSNNGLLYLAEAGAFILMAQMFVAAAMKEPNKMKTADATSNATKA